MTSDEAISIMNVIVHMLEPQYDTDRVEDAVEMAIKALSSSENPNKWVGANVLNHWIGAEVLNKIRAEIDEQYDRVHPYDISCAEGLEMALGIIDKYIAEGSDNE